MRGNYPHIVVVCKGVEEGDFCVIGALWKTCQCFGLSEASFETSSDNLSDLVIFPDSGHF